jgi:hypothetical protein
VRRSHGKDGLNGVVVGVANKLYNHTGLAPRSTAYN